MLLTALGTAEGKRSDLALVTDFINEIKAKTVDGSTSGVSDMTAVFLRGDVKCHWLQPPYCSQLM